MLKKFALITLAALIFIFLSSCKFFSAKTIDETASDYNDKIESVEPTENDDFDYEKIEAAFSYLDPKIDMSLLIEAPGWRYQKDNDEGMVLFYNEHNNDGLTSFAISANTQRDKSFSDANLDDITENLWEESIINLENGISSFEWTEENKIPVGNYFARRFRYKGILSSIDESIEGDYLFWWTKDKLYICSFITYPQKYNENFEVLENSLATFLTYEEIN